MNPEQQTPWDEDDYEREEARLRALGIIKEEYEPEEDD